jgi:hypothetical protein
MPPPGIVEALLKLNIMAQDMSSEQDLESSSNANTTRKILLAHTFLTTPLHILELRARPATVVTITNLRH